MADGQTNRRLAAILAADVVGYSRMMAADEAGTLAALKHHREAVFDPTVAQYHGRIVKLIGDGTLVEFTSVVDAVNCALAIQRQPQPADAAHVVTLRIGINLGDVIIEGDDIYGDGVNVAARLEPLAEPGGICIASIVNESVGNRIDTAFEDGGEVHVKNIDRPIRVFKWSGKPASAAAPPTAARPPQTRPAEKPSVAVLPFDNMSGDREQEYFSDGISEDIITDLSQVGGLIVIARNSSFVYKGKHQDIRSIARDLGVRFVLEGSIRRAGQRVRITAQLIEAASGSHVWAQRYDRELVDVFAVQDDVTRQIVAALKVTLTQGERERLAGSGTTDLEAYDLCARGVELVRGAVQNRQIFTKTTELLQQAIERDAGYARPNAFLCIAHGFNYVNRWTADSEASLALAGRYAARAIEIGPDDPYSHFAAAIHAAYAKDIERWSAEVAATLSISPNFASALSMRGEIKMYLGHPLEGAPDIEQAMRLDPAHGHQLLHFLGMAYLLAGKFETASAMFSERILLSPGTDSSRSYLAATLGHLGRLDEARAVWRELKTVNPNYSFADHVARVPFQRQADIDLIKAGLAKARLPN
jgi:adenylate cyclase